MGVTMCIDVAGIHTRTNIADVIMVKGCSCNNAKYNSPVLLLPTSAPLPRGKFGVVTMLQAAEFNEVGNDGQVVSSESKNVFQGYTGRV